MPDFLGIERLTFGPWPAFERVVQRFFLHSGFQDCRLVGGPGDHGADVLATKDGRLWVAQAKFRSADVGVGEGAVKEVIEAVNRYGAQEAVVATNQHFGPEAFTAANRFSGDIGVPVRLWGGQTFLEWCKSLPSNPAPRKELRPYQEAAVDAVDAARSLGKRQGLVVMATGLGKTRVAGEIILRELWNQRGSEALVLAHTVDLVHQFEAALWEVLPKEVSTHIWAAGERPAYAGGVICGTMQSILNAGKAENLTGRYSLIVVDEAHHAPADGYRKLLEALEPRFLLGLTATPWRGDERLLSEMFGEPIFYMSIVEGMQQGYLADVDYRMLVDDIDWEKVPELTRHGLTVAELNRRLFIPQRDESVVELIVRHLDELDNPRCIIFCRTVDHANTTTKLLRAYGKPCGVIHSKLGRIEATNVLRAFRVGSVPTLVSVDMLNEGIDVPDVNVVVFLRVTHSRRIFVQQLGRGLRLREGKAIVRVLDFVSDIRRVAAGLQMNREAKSFAHRTPGKETLRFLDGQIVKFSNDRALDLFAEYLEDVAAVEDLDEQARLKFPPPVVTVEDQ